MEILEPVVSKRKETMFHFSECDNSVFHRRQIMLDLIGYNFYKSL